MNMFNPSNFQAMNLALTSHAPQSYGGMNYGVHVFRTAFWGMEILKDITSEVHLPETVISDYINAFFLHDVIEDSGINFNDLVKQFGINTAELVFAVSGHGKNRKERWACQASQISKYPMAIVVKYADRLANYEACVINRDPRRGMYGDEAQELLKFGWELQSDYVFLKIASESYGRFLKEIDEAREVLHAGSDASAAEQQSK
jgi:(p)ppGpp synthase/HD superfamily hydrolase